jgi:hypothetical protein
VAGDEGEPEFYELVDASSVGPVQHPAARYFAARCQELTETRKVRGPGGRVQRLTPRAIQRMLKQRAPDLAISETQFYRFYHGEVAPRLDVVYEVAALFGVSPREFLPDTTD